MIVLFFPLLVIRQSSEVPAEETTVVFPDRLTLALALFALTSSGHSGTVGYVLSAVTVTGESSSARTSTSVAITVGTADVESPASVSVTSQVAPRGNGVTFTVGAATVTCCMIGASV